MTKLEKILIGIVGWSLLMVLVTILIGATVATPPGTCKHYAIASTADDFQIATSGSTITAQLEPDTTGNGTGTEVTVYTCTDSDDSNLCELWYYDSDYDGAPDTAIMTGVSWPLQKRNIVVGGVAGIVKFDTTTFDEAASIFICGLRH